MLSGPDHQELMNALTEFFNKNTMARLIQANFNVRLDCVVADNAFDHMMFELVQWAEMQGKTKNLIKAAYLYQPNEVFLAIANKHGVEVENSPPPSPV